MREEVNVMNIAENSVKTAVGKPFPPGVSGNPGGRPKEKPEVKEMLRAATEDAARLLVDTINDETARLELRIKCCEIVLDRVYGKPRQALEVDTKNIPPVIFVGGEQIAD